MYRQGCRIGDWGGGAVATVRAIGGLDFNPTCLMNATSRADQVLLPPTTSLDS